MRASNVNVWLVNTGWSGGPFGVGSRMSLKQYTRAMITAALNWRTGQRRITSTHPVFGLAMPTTCPNVPERGVKPYEILGQIKDADDDTKANHLAGLFNKNFENFESGANEEIRSAAPKATSAS